MSGMIAGAVLANLASNAMADAKANTQFENEQQLMNKQNKMNQHNALMAYMNQVQGAKLAGLNPAMLNGATPQVAAPVTKGNAQMAENVEFDPANLLIQAQADKTKAETKAIENVNDQTDAANDAMTQGLIQDFNTEIDDLTKNLAKVKPDSTEYNQISGRIKELQKMRDKLSDGTYRGALGILKGTESARKNAHERANILTEYLNGKIDRSVALKKVDNGTIDAIAKMPKLEQEKLAEDIEHIKQLIAESESKEKLNDQMVLKLQTDISEIGDRILRSRLSDENYIRFMAEHADSQEERDLYKKSILNNLTDTELRKWRYDLGKSVITGAATGGALGAAGGAMNSVGKAMGSKKSKSGMDKFDDYVNQGKKARNASNSVPPFKTGFPNGPYNDYGPYNFGVENMKK